MHLVGFIIRICNDEQSPERQINDSALNKSVNIMLKEHLGKCSSRKAKK